MSSVLVRESVETIVIDDADLSWGVTTIWSCDNLQSWIDRGEPVDDIEMEAKNTANCARFRVSYQQMRDELCAKYGISEHELVGHLLHGMIR